MPEKVDKPSDIEAGGISWRRLPRVDLSDEQIAAAIEIIHEWEGNPTSAYDLLVALYPIIAPDREAI